MIITIDGASGTGKSTVARTLAVKIGFVYFDTGAMYRAFTWFVMEKNVDVNDSDAIERLLTHFKFNIEEKEGVKHYFVAERDVTEVIRSRHVTARVSEVSAIALVRRSLLGIQYEFAKTKNAVFEGRDLGTVIFPQAEVKVFLEADPQIRAERRLNEILAKNSEESRNLNRNQMVQDLLERDRYDSTREHAPLRCPEGAFKIDTTDLSIDQVVDKIVNYCTNHYPQYITL